MSPENLFRMKQFFISALAFFITFNTLSAQQNHLKPNQLVLESKKIHKTIPVQLFNLSNTRNKVEIPEQIKNYSILDLNQQGLRQLMHDRSPLISLNLPQQGRNDITLELVEVKPFAEDFTVKTAPEMKTIEVNIGKHYRGIIKGQERSIVAISIFDDQIMGLISHPSATGNMVVGKLENSENYILYQDDQIADQFNFDCKSKDHEIEYTSDQLNETTTGTRALTDCIRLYLEVDYDIYVNKGSSTTAVTNFVTGIFNQVITLYSNEQINTVVSEIVIWTQQSPYNSTSSINMLNAFTGYRQGFNGDLAQLLSYKASGGVAYVDGLCRSNPDYSMSYAGIQSTYQNVPAYSWSVEVCTHEFGHLFGSQHTHACVWNGNNTAIDGCYTPEGGCANPGIPSSSVGGTIMSYCHLTGAGINFSNGFGPQPGNVIRSRVSSVTCLQACSGGNPGGGTQCTSNTLTLELRTDNYPGETTWNIKSSTGVILYSGGPYSTANTLNTISLCLPTACYTFNINDTYGDGICCSYGSGYYNIKQGTTTLITGGQFGAAESKSFCATGTTAALTLSASTGSVAASAGSTSVGVTANVSWTAVSNATSWCTVTPASGSNNGTLNVAYTANTTSTSRSAIITVAGGGLTQSYTLTQSGNTPTLTLSAATGSAAAAAGSATVGVTANISWTAVSNATSWCTVTPASGANNGTLNVAFTANTTTTSRSATITVSGSGLTRTYVLTQTGNTPTLTLSAATGSVASTAGTTSVGVTANISWTAVSNATSWCTVTPANGANNGTINVVYTANTTTTSRSATITVSGSGLTRTYVLTQTGNTPTLTLSAATGSVASAAGTTSVGVTANISWTAASNATTWCTVTPASGANNGTINVVYTANTTSTSRSATITVSGSGLTRTYVLTQTGNTPTLTLSAATGNVAPTAGTTSVGVTANLSWTAASNASSRCTVTPASGSNNGSFTISYTNNTTSTIRIATITVTGSGLTRTYVLTQSGSSSGTTLSGHYFENGWDGWVDGGSDCFRYAGSLSPEGNYSIRLRDNSAEQSAMSSPNYNLTAYNTVQVEFKFRSNSMETGEDFRLLYFNGSTWSIVGTFVSGTNFYNNQLYTTTVTLTGSFSSASKFRFQNDANENDDEVYIDAVIIRASTGSASFENPIVIVAEGNEIYKLRDDSMVEIFPNPASDIIFTKSDEDIRQIKVYNISGQLMLNVTSDKIESVDTSNLINGLYIMSIETEENVYTEKFIKN